MKVAAHSFCQKCFLEKFFKETKTKTINNLLFLFVGNGRFNLSTKILKTLAQF